ncbi:MAG: histidinol-phosphatase [Lachnospiraceae bacterium]|nr:histidinol-phosphatase [Lachnospiraceae bacterium]
MLANYHTHTWRCRHASGTEREYIEHAIRAGLKVLGFSDHTPIPFKGGYVSDHRMPPDLLEDYVTTVSALKAEYSREIEIHLGLEFEYAPRYLEEQLAVMRDYPIEYLLLGQHFLEDEIGGAYCGKPTRKESTLVKYREVCEEAMHSGLYLYFAHPDVIHFIGDASVYEREMHHLCETARSLSIPLEINLLGIDTHRNYPNPLFWKIAGEVGCDAVIGCDAHRAEDVTRPAAYEKAMRIVKDHHLHLLTELSLKGLPR